MGRKIGTFGLINYRRHPKDPNYIVFGFDNKNDAAIFESELHKNKTWFEKDSEETKDGIIYLFAINESNLNEGTRANGIVMRANKKPLIKNQIARYSILIIMTVLIVIAIIGYVKNPNKAIENSNQPFIDSLKLEE